MFPLILSLVSQLNSCKHSAFLDAEAGIIFITALPKGKWAEEELSLHSK